MKEKPGDIVFIIPKCTMIFLKSGKDAIAGCFLLLRKPTYYPGSRIRIIVPFSLPFFWILYSDCCRSNIIYSLSGHPDRHTL
jgi:hypothetical protein